jgi:hypothetical protein
VQALFFGVEEKEMSIIEQAWLDLHAAALAEQGKAGRSKLDRAHPYPVGTGPAGQTCGTCAKLCEIQYSKKYFKCRVIMAAWTHGPGTDIRKKDPACKCWEPRIDKVEILNVRNRP